MAYDGHRNPPPPPMDQTPYPPYDTYPDPRAYQSPKLGPSYPPDYRPRSRATSTVQTDGFYPPPPLDTAAGAVNTAFDRVAINNAFHKTNVANQVSPEVIARIAEQVRAQVIDSLKESGLAAATQSQQPPPPPPPQGYVPLSPTTSTTASFPSRNVYTPPSPDRHDFSSPLSGSPPDPSHQDSQFFSTGKEDLSDRYGERNPSPERPSRTRPAPAPRMMTSEEETILEKIWGPLFDAESKPTARLGQLLRGLALHIVSPAT